MITTTDTSYTGDEPILATHIRLISRCLQRLQAARSRAVTTDGTLAIF